MNRLSKKDRARIVGEAHALAAKTTHSDVAGESDDDCIYWPKDFAAGLSPYRRGTEAFNVFGRAFVSYVKDTYQEDLSDWTIENWEDADVD